MSVTVGLHNPVYATAPSFFAATDDLPAFTSISIRTNTGAVLPVYGDNMRIRAMADAINNPTPDLLAAIDPRLEDVSQNEPGRFVYRECEIERNPRGIYDWTLRGGDCGSALTLIGALDDIDEYLLDDMPDDDDPQHHADMQEMADDDRTHALRERRDEAAIDAAE